MIYRQAKTNIYGGIEIPPQALPDSSEEFASQLAEALATWERNGYKVVWLEIPAGKSALIPGALKEGFTFHHTGDDYLVLTKQLQAHAFIPPYASHHVGAGGAVFTDQDELLVVVEKVHAVERPQYYKLPGGLVDEGEHIVDGVMREVYEETGIRTRFESLICLRHSHHWRFQKSALYFICRLAPLTRQITLEEDEIAEARWMPVNDFLANEHVSSFNKHIVQLARQQKGMAYEQIVGYGSTVKDAELFSFQSSDTDRHENPDV